MQRFRETFLWPLHKTQTYKSLIKEERETNIDLYGLTIHTYGCSLQPRPSKVIKWKVFWPLHYHCVWRNVRGWASLVIQFDYKAHLTQMGIYKIFINFKEWFNRSFNYSNTHSFSLSDHYYSLHSGFTTLITNNCYILNTGFKNI